MVERIFGTCSGPDWCPHAVQNGAGHQPRGNPGERWRRHYVSKRDRCMGGGNHGGGGLFHQAWKPWETVAPRRGGEGASKRCALETNVAEC